MKKIEHEKPRFMKKFVHKSIWAYHYATDATNDGQQAWFLWLFWPSLPGSLRKIALSWYGKGHQSGNTKPQFAYWIYEGKDLGCEENEIKFH